MTTAEKPHVDDAPGLIWRPMKARWEARWQARTDLIERGFHPKSVRLWAGVELGDGEASRIADRCQQLQARMIAFSRGAEIPQTGHFDGTLAGLIACYQTDPDSGYRKLRYVTRQNYDSLANRLQAQYGDTRIEGLKARTFLRWHEGWTEGGKVAMGHSMVAMLRTLFSFGATIMEDDQCARVKGLLSDMRFGMSKPRTQHLTAEQARAICSTAHEYGFRSIALAQALQFELMLRQRDALGEWVPVGEPGISDIIHDDLKWLRGVRWEEIDENLILRHVTSKKQKEIEVDLKVPPMVMHELRYVAQDNGWRKFGAQSIYDGTAAEPPLPAIAARSDLPARGPVVVCEVTALPWRDFDFRRIWRKLARASGVPDSVFSMDSRAGGITEATDLGATLEDLRHAATHSQTSTTARYSRGSAEKTAKVMQLRASGRAKTGTNGSETE